MAISGTKMQTDTALLTLIFDVVNWLKWAQTKDAAKGQNRPKSLYESLTQTGTKEKVESFASAEDFEQQRAALLGEIDGNRDREGICSDHPPDEGRKGRSGE